jgi:hypothetical protein
MVRLYLIGAVFGIRDILVRNPDPDSRIRTSD